VKISVVVPCRNEVNYIEECIRAIFQCDLPKEATLSVFIVDGMSNDGTREKILSLKNEFPSLHLVDNERQLTPFAFNLGIYQTACDFVQIVGARHILSKNYMLRCLEKLQHDPSIWCVGGKIINEYLNETGEIISIAMSTSFGMGLGNFRTLDESGFTDTVTSPMYPYAVFEKIGFFDEELIRNQDDDFNFRVTKAGGKIFFDAEISLKYYVRGNYPGLWRQFFQYGYWKVYVNQKHKAVTTLRQLVPPLFVAYLILWLASTIFIPFVRIFAFWPLMLYILLGLFIAFKQVYFDTSNTKKALRIFVTFPILHIAYGLGYLQGIVEFLVFRNKPSSKQTRLSR
jgi:glycosyltransferase involved in cell wall biosynthesis